MDKTKPPEWTGRKPKKRTSRVKTPTWVDLRCLWHTRLVIGETQTLSGHRYVFEPGQVQPVRPVDVERLLAMEKTQPPGCCGAEANPPVLKFFELVS